MGEDTGGGELPASFEMAWGVRERPTKGPRRGLSLEQIVAAAVRLAAADGLGAVSMSRVAKEVGTSAMALYRYVASKDELLALMGDQAIGEVAFTAGDGGWRVELKRWAWAELNAYGNNPWSLQVPIHGPPVTPHTIAFLEQGLRCMAGTPLTPQDKLSACLTLSSFTRAWAMLGAQLDPEYGTNDRELMQDYERALRSVADREHFPALYEVLDAHSFTPGQGDDLDDDFVFGLDRLMDGFEALMNLRGA
jgi:AcrR family transcriptional regulator